jgi:hypothetical protein
MSLSVRPLYLSLLALTLLSPLGCKTAGGQGSGSAASISGPLTILPDYQARAPRTCATVTSPPSVAQAAIMVQCSMDGLSDTGLSLVQNVNIQIGKSRPFVYNTDAGLAGIDLTAAVYPLQGSYTGYFCSKVGGSLVLAGHSCIRNVVATSQGWCWKTSFGDYKCKMHGGASTMEQGMPAPQTF